MRSRPADLPTARLAEALAAGWRIRAKSMHYVPEGGGSYHWKLIDHSGRPHFVTVDDLDGKQWLGDTRDAVFAGLRRALTTAVALRDGAGLDFVVAPSAAGDREPLRRIDSRYAVSVFPFLGGHSFPFGRHPDARLRGQALDMIAALHQATPAVRDHALRHAPSFSGRSDLEGFLLDPDRPWDCGPYSEAARQLFATCTAELARLAADFDRLVEVTCHARAEPVITHGEPHPANLMWVDGHLVLIDWDTAALGPPERDVSVLATPGDEGAVDRYQEAAGRELEPAVLALYRLRWYLDDLASAIRLFRNRHDDTADTRRWWQGLPRQLEQLPRWLDLQG